MKVMEHQRGYKRFTVKRLRDGSLMHYTEAWGDKSGNKVSEGRQIAIPAADLVHAFDGWLPLQVAAALALTGAVLSAVLEAYPAERALAASQAENQALRVQYQVA